MIETRGEIERAHECFTFACEIWIFLCYKLPNDMIYFGEHNFIDGKLI